MKKLFGLFVALAMMLTIASFAFADEEVVGDNSTEDTSLNETVVDTNTTVEEPVVNDTVVNETIVDENVTEDVVVNDTVVNNTVVDENVTEVVNDTTVDQNTTVVVNETTDANETVSDEDATEEAGTTPDSALWGLDRALERISLALTLGKSAKAKMGLAHAKERLLEVQAMIAAKKADKAAKAQEAFEDTMQEVTENVDEMGDGDGEQELADQVEIEKAAKKNEMILNNIRLKVNGLSDEQKSQLSSVISGLQNVTSDFKVKVQVNKNKSMIKIKAEKGASDAEIAALENALKQGEELAKVRIVKQGAGAVKERGSDKVKEDKTEETEQEAPEEEPAEEPEVEDESSAENETDDSVPAAKGKGKNK